MRQLAVTKKTARKPAVRRQGPSVPTNDPVVASVKAMVRPFDVSKGVASSLLVARPSQKFMAKANTSISIPAGCYMTFMCSPCIAADSLYVSVIFAIQSSSGVLMSGPFKNSVAGTDVVTNGTLSYLVTNTPYAVSSLSGTGVSGGYEWACAGSGLRFTYEGAELYKSGTFKYIHDIERAFNAGYVDWTVKGPAAVINYLDTAPNCIRQSINKNNVVEVNSFIPSLYGPVETPNYWADQSGSTVGGAGGSNKLFSNAPSVLGYFLNSSSASISFHVECVEHWTISAPAIQALHTDSVGHDSLHTQVANFLHSSRQLHATQPNGHHVDSMKAAKKALGSPLGHDLMNAALTAALA